MDFIIPEELQMVRRTVRSFIEEHLKPLEAQTDGSDHCDYKEMMRLRALAADYGLYAHNIPRELGGGGLSMLGQVIVAEELGRTTIPLGHVLGYLPEMLLLARPDQQEWFLKPLVAAKKCYAYGVTEPDAGSDVRNIRTRAVRTGNQWLVNGSKQFVSGVDVADFIMVLAITEPAAELRERFTIFIVERDNPGFKYIRKIRKMGWHGMDFCAFALDDCLVDEDHVLGTVGAGFGAIMNTINKTRIQLSGKYVGMADELLQQGLQYAKQRVTFGKKLGEHQAIQFALADCDCELEAARLLLYSAATAIDSGHTDVKLAASRIKLYGSEMVGRVADRILQIFGAAGYTTDFSIERMYRDARAFRIGEGSSEMQRIQIAKHLLQ